MMPRIPPVTLFLLIANGLVYLLQATLGDIVDAHFALWPLGADQLARLHDGSVVHVGFSFWQLITYGFLHGGFSHIAFNMFALWSFGGPVETALGERRFTIYYFVCVLGAACAQLAFMYFFTPTQFYPTVGASGGVFGLLLAFAVIYPRAQIALMFIPIPIAAPIAVVGYLLVELFLGVSGIQRGVAHFAHLGGALVGFALLLAWRAQTRKPQMRRPD